MYSLRQDIRRSICCQWKLAIVVVDIIVIVCTAAIVLNDENARKETETADIEFSFSKMLPTTAIVTANHDDADVVNDNNNDDGKDHNGDDDDGDDSC